MHALRVLDYQAIDVIASVAGDCGTNSTRNGERVRGWAHIGFKLFLVSH